MFCLFSDLRIHLTWFICKKQALNPFALSNIDTIINGQRKCLCYVTRAYIDYFFKNKWFIEINNTIVSETFHFYRWTLFFSLQTNISCYSENYLQWNFIVGTVCLDFGLSAIFLLKNKTVYTVHICKTSIEHITIFISEYISKRYH